MIIGEVELPSGDKHVPFVGEELSPPPREVKAAMSVILKLVLGHGTDQDLPRDELMRSIALSSNSTQVSKANSTSKPNKKFVEDFLDMLSYNLTFNEFFHRTKIDALQSDDVINALTEGATHLRHNHGILARYIRSFDPDQFSKLFPTGVHATTDVNKILQRRRTILGKAKKSGVRTMYPPSKAGHQADSFLWVHHFFLLQFIEPTIQKLITVNSYDHVGNVTHVGGGKSINDFLSCLTIKKIEGYGSDKEYFNIVAWKGAESVLSDN